MKLVKNLMAAVVLVFALAVGSYAGDQQTPGFTSPQPAQQTPSTSCSQETATYNPEPCTAPDANEAPAPDPLIIDVITALLGWF
jgi:hypothetical protein